MLSGASGVEPPPLNLMGLMGCSFVVDDGPGCVGNCVSGKAVSSIDDATEMMWLPTSPTHAAVSYHGGDPLVDRYHKAHQYNFLLLILLSTRLV